MEPLASPEWREQLLGYLEQACQNPSSNLYQLAQEFSYRIDDQQGREQHVKKVLEDTQTTFKTRLKAGAYDQLPLDEVDAQLLDILRSRHNLLIFGRYIELHKPTLLGYARTLTPSSDAEDLLGKAWMTVCNALDKHPLLLIENLDAWFHIVLQNTNKNKHRQETAQKRGSADSLEVMEEEHAFEVQDDKDEQPDVALLRKESQETVAELILHLPLSSRRTMTLYLLYDWSARQIADSCQLPIDTVKSHIRRSLPLLRLAFLNRHPALKGELDAYILTLPLESQQVLNLFLTLGPNYQVIAKRLGSPHTLDTVTACIEQHLPYLSQLLLTQAS